MLYQKETMTSLEICPFFGHFEQHKTMGCIDLKMGAKENAGPRNTVFYPVFKSCITPLFRQQKTALFDKCRYCVVFRI